MTGSRQRIRLIENDGEDYTSSWGERVTKAVQHQIYAHVEAPKNRREAVRRRQEALLSLESIRADQDSRRARALAEGRDLDTDRVFQDTYARSERARRHWIGLLQALEHWLSFEPEPPAGDEIAQLKSGVLELVELMLSDVDGAPEEDLKTRLRQLRVKLL